MSSDGCIILGGVGFVYNTSIGGIEGEVSSYEQAEMPLSEVCQLRLVREY